MTVLATSLVLLQSESELLIDSTADSVSDSTSLTVTNGTKRVAVKVGDRVLLFGYITAGSGTAGDIMRLGFRETDPSGNVSTNFLGPRQEMSNTNDDITCPNWAFITIDEAGTWQFELQWNRSAGSGTLGKLSSSFLVLVLTAVGTP